MENLTQWDGTEFFSGSEAGALIMGINPSSSNRHLFHAVVHQMELAFEATTAFVSLRVSGVSDEHDDKHVEPENYLFSTELANLVDSYYQGDELSLVNWLESPASIFDKQTFSRNQISSWLDRYPRYKSAYSFARDKPAVETAVETTDRVKPIKNSPSPLSLEARLPLTRSAMITQFKAMWPTIESDLADASKNGLAAAAKAGTRDWREQEAMEWARAKNKLQPNNSANNLDDFMNRFSSRVIKLGD